jgi:phage tail sheath protein FI
MPQYLSPGVYVEEVPASMKPIAGVSTSTAGFVGIVPDVISIPGGAVTNENVGAGNGNKTVFNLSNYPVVTDAGSFQVRVKGAVTAATLSNDDAKKISQVTFSTAPTSGTPSGSNVITVDYIPTPAFTVAPAAEVHLCTTFSDYKKFFGDFSTDAGQRNLTHAVYGFFNNGGTRCYVVRAAAANGVAAALANFETIDEIAIVAAPGVLDANSQSLLITHCAQLTQDRFAILDSPATVETTGALDLTLFDPANAKSVMPPFTDYGAVYFPWIQVFDPATQFVNPAGDGMQFVPPSGHVAGIYARVDSVRGVHKAPANETILGALGLRYNLSKAQQDGLNPRGVNCIRNLNGNIRVWGARTIGGDANADLKYINVRRTLLFIRESIDEGTQWVVFEPNTSSLWAKIERNISAFLLGVWRDGALFGDTPDQAFYVKCDAELNPPEVRDLGQVITEVGVSIVRPAEFVIFRISQWTAPS